MKQVVVAREHETVTVDELSTSKGYIMFGTKGEFIVARDTDGKYIWVRLNPTSNISKPSNAFDTLKEAINSKLEAGFDVYEYTSVDVA